jgi:hypothetical protein
MLVLISGAVRPASPGCAELAHAHLCTACPTGFLCFTVTATSHTCAISAANPFFQNNLPQLSFSTPLGRWSWRNMVKWKWVPQTFAFNHITALPENGEAHLRSLSSVQATFSHCSQVWVLLICNAYHHHRSLPKSGCLPRCQLQVLQCACIWKVMGPPLNLLCTYPLDQGKPTWGKISAPTSIQNTYCR